MKVSVCMITYNHENFIEQALENVLKQETDFPVEIVIGEDFSKDRTRQICIDYAAKYPGVIKLITTEYNVGMQKNFFRTYKECDGNYIAFIEGDDYWTDPLKLQKQVDFLNANPDYCACFHNVVLKNTRNNIVQEWPFITGLQKDTFVTEDLLSAWFIPSGSVVFERDPGFILPDWFYFCKSGDIPFLLLLSLQGKLKYLNEVMGVYRLHDNGISATHIGYDKIVAMIYIYENFNVHTNYKFKDRIREAVIYEITHHMPKVDNNQLLLPKKPDILIRSYKRIKRLINFRSKKVLNK